MSRRSNIKESNSLSRNNDARPLTPSSAEIKYEKSRRSDLKSFTSRTPYEFSDEDVFLITHGKIKFNFETKRIEFDRADLSEKKPLFVKHFKTHEGFTKSLEFVEFIMNEMAEDMFFDKDSLINLRIEPAKISVPAKNLVQGYYSYSPYRYEYDYMEEFVEDYVRSLLISTFVAKVADETSNFQNNEPFFYRELPAKFSVTAPKLTNSLYARDFSLTVGGKLYYQKKDDIESIYLSKDITLSENIDITKTDLDSEIQDAEFLPFLIQGGNVVVDENRKIILFQDCWQETEMEFLESEKNFYQKIKNWSIEHGYTPVMVERDLSRSILSLNDVYHLDVYLNVIGKYIIVPNEKILSPDTRKQLEELYGEENIIPLSYHEREAMCTNFITFGNRVVMTSPKTPQSFIDKLTMRGFEVVIPPIQLARSNNSGVRCYTQIAPDSMIKNARKEGLEAMKVRVDHKSPQEREYQEFPKVSIKRRDVGKTSQRLGQNVINNSRFE